MTKDEGDGRMMRQECHFSLEPSKSDPQQRFNIILGSCHLAQQIKS